MKLTSVNIGSDPEIFLFDEKIGEMIPAIGLIPGTKEKPFPITEEGHFIQVDNVAAEFCVPPTMDPKEMYSNIQICLKAIEERAQEYVPMAKIAVVASHSFRKSFLDHPIAKEFGCDSDMNAWTEIVNPKPIADDECLRSCGGHLHLSYNNPNYETSLQIIKAMDLFLGVPSVLLDDDTRRRELYGKAGSFRFKNYGIEYRSLSNFWIKSQESVDWVYEQIQKVIDFINEGKTLHSSEGDEIQKCINTGDRELAKQLIEKYNVCTIKENIKEESN